MVDHTDPSWDKLDESNMYTDNAVNPCIPSTYNFVSTVVQALVDMHRDVMPLTAYHFGGDEVPAGAWRNSTACTALLPGLDLSSNADLKKYFAKQVRADTYNPFLLFFANVFQVFFLLFGLSCVVFLEPSWLPVPSLLASCMFVRTLKRLVVETDSPCSVLLNVSKRKPEEISFNLFVCVCRSPT